MEFYKLSIMKALERYKQITIDYNKLMQFAAGIDANEKAINRINTLEFENFKKAVNELCDEQVLKPYGKETTRGLCKKYRVLNNYKNKSRDAKTTAKILSYTFPNVDYYLKRQEEYQQDIKVLEILHEYYTKPDKPRLTANELGVYLFNDEKAFEQPDERHTESRYGQAMQVVNKLKLNLDKCFNAYVTIEPFFYFVRKSFFEKSVREILIIENKDTYYSFYRSNIGNSYDMIIYGEGNKITGSFSNAMDYGIQYTDNIHYFGDIDPAGFAIYYHLKQSYSEYNFSLASMYYYHLIYAYKNKVCPKIKHSVIPSTLEKAYHLIDEEFKDKQREFLLALFADKRYIPQEAIALINL